MDCDKSDERQQVFMEAGITQALGLDGVAACCEDHSRSEPSSADPLQNNEPAARGMPMRVFGQKFEYVGDGTVGELLSLEREGAVYGARWIEELNDFRHIRIGFTADEVKEYVRSMAALEAFLAAGSPPRAAVVPTIPTDIAKRADAYELRGADGRLLASPHHCKAGFLGPDLETLLLCTPRERRTMVPAEGTAGVVGTVKRIVDSLIPAIRRFNNRERGLRPWVVEREDDVRDLLYAMLRGSVEDVCVEEPMPSKAGKSSVADIFSAAARLIVEVKWLGPRGRWKRVVDEISVDIQAYAKHPGCRTLFFVVIDVGGRFPDPARMERELTGHQVIDGRELEIFVFIRQP